MNQTQNQINRRLNHFRALYENAKEKFDGDLAVFERHMAQYRGSHEIDGSCEDASTVRNITYEIIESQVSSQIPQPKVDPCCYSERRDRNAKSVERLCASLRNKLSFEEMNDMDERYTYIYGGSVWLVEWDNDAGVGGEVGGVKVSCLSPKDLIPQPGMTKISEMDYCFLRFATTRRELMRRFAVSEEQLTLAATEDRDGTDDGIATVVLCFYRGEDGEIGQYCFSGELELSDLPHYYRRKFRQCRSCHERAEDCRCESPKLILCDETEETLAREVIDTPTGAKERFFRPSEVRREGAGTHPIRIPYYTPKTFPIVIRKNTSGEDRLFGQSDCEYLRPEQQAINKMESRILQKLLRAGITPVVPEDATITLNNSVFGQMIRMKPGESAAQYGKVDTTPDIGQDIAEAERLYLHAKRILGISDAYQGISNAQNESGFARQLQIAQASGRLESKKTMKYTAYAEIDRLIFSYYLAFADEPRLLCYRDAYGRIHNAQFNRLDFIEYDARRGRYYYDDGYLFSVDQNGGVESQRAELWERNLENLRSGALGDVRNPLTLLRYWQSQERAHYPFARENVEYFLNAERDGAGKEGDAYDDVLIGCDATGA